MVGVYGFNCESPKCSGGLVHETNIGHLSRLCHGDPMANRRHPYDSFPTETRVFMFFGLFSQISSYHCVSLGVFLCDDLPTEPKIVFWDFSVGVESVFEIG